MRLSQSLDNLMEKTKSTLNGWGDDESKSDILPDATLRIAILE